MSNGSFMHHGNNKFLNMQLAVHVPSHSAPTVDVACTHAHRRDRHMRRGTNYTTRGLTSVGWTNTEPVLVFGLKLCVRQSIHLHHGHRRPSVKGHHQHSRVFLFSHSHASHTLHTHIPHPTHTLMFQGCTDRSVRCNPRRKRSDSFLQDRTNLSDAVPGQHNKHLLRHLATTAHKHQNEKFAISAKSVSRDRTVLVHKFFFIFT